jgi:prephenate dehydrogenase
VNTCAIIGVGLIGGSFGLALRKAGFRGAILGVDYPEPAARALERGAISEATSLESAAARADLLYLAQPIGAILETLPKLDTRALVTDTGSTKAAIVSCAATVIRRGQFLGGHPMAGKAVSGVDHADADLFAGRTYVLTPRDPSELETPAAREFRGWLEAIGARPVIAAPEEHDRIVAATSHLPQLLSTALAGFLAERLGGRSPIAGPGLDDMLRLAGSPYDLWRDILATNDAEIDAALRDFGAALERLRADLASVRMREAFEAAQRFKKGTA